MSIYEPLVQFLAAARGGAVRLSFAEIERALGRRLPSSARKHQAWWANSDSHTQAATWMAAGWQTEQVDLGGETVVFARRARASAAVPAAARAGGDVVVLPRAQLSTGLRRAIDDLMAEDGLDETRAVLALLDEAVTARRAARLSAFAVGDGRSGDSAAMIRADRDAR